LRRPPRGHRRVQREAAPGLAGGLSRGSPPAARTGGVGHPEDPVPTPPTGVLLVADLLVGGVACLVELVAVLAARLLVRHVGGPVEAGVAGLIALQIGRASCRERGR